MASRCPTVLTCLALTALQVMAVALRKLRGIYLALLLLVLAHLQVIGQYLTDEVLIQDSSKLSAQINQLQTSYRLSKAEISKLPYWQVSDVLRTIPGLQIRDYGGIGGLKTVNSRGLGANHTLLLKDGMAMQQLGAATADLSMQTIDGLGSVTLATGLEPTPTATARQWASNAILNLATEQPVLHGFAGHIGGSMGSFGLQTLTAGLQTSGADFWLQSQGSFARQLGDYAYTQENGQNSVSGTRQHNATTQWQTYHIGQWQATQRLKLQGQYLVQGQQQQLPGALILYQTNPTGQYLRRFEQQGRLSAIYKRQFWALHGEASGQEQRSSYHDPHFLGGDGNLIRHYHWREGTGALTLTASPFSWLISQVSQELAASSFQHDMPMVLQPQRLTSYTNLSTQANFGKVQLMGHVLQTNVVIGNEQQVLASQTTTWGLAALWQIMKSPSHQLNARASSRQFFRLPSFNDLYFNLVLPNVKPERVWQHELGLSWAYQQPRYSTLIQASVYHADHTDKIVAVPSQQLFFYSVRNIGLSRATGFELQVKASKKFKHFQTWLQGSFTHQRVTDLSNPSFSTFEQQLAYTPHEFGSLNYGFQFQAASIALSHTGTGHRYAGDPSPSNYLAAFWLHDLALGYQLPWFKPGSQVQVQVCNLSNTQYQLIAAFPMPGINWRISTNIHF